MICQGSASPPRWAGRALRWAGRALLVAVLLCLGAPAHAALDDDTVRQRAQHVLADPEYQTKRPDGGASPNPKPEQKRRARSDGGGDPTSVKAPSEISMVLVWIVLGGILVFVAVMIGTQARRGIRRKSALSKPKVIAAPIAHGELDADKLDETLRAALALAAAGRFEEAVHLLLTGAIRELQQNVGLATEVALTSRELLAAANLRPEPQDAFKDLVFAVEVSLFGGVDVSQADFERCATSFRTLRRAAAT